MTESILSRHAAAWMEDRWYRAAWFVWPSSCFLFAATLLTTDISKPVAPLKQPAWAHASPVGGANGKAEAALRDQARSDPEALKLLRMRADANDPVAQFYVATLLDPTLDRARATPERTAQALALYRSSADRGTASAAANLGFLLAYDRPGSPANLPEAFRYLEQSAPTVPMAQRELGQMYRLGRGVGVDQAKGMEMIRSAAERGDASAQTILAQAYDRGTDGLTSDPHEAALLYQRAAIGNIVFAQRELAIHLRDGLGVPADQEKAMAWFRRAAERGDSYSKAQIARAPAPTTGASEPAASPPPVPFFLHPRRH